MIEKYTYAELSKEDLYEILRLRTEVFVVEQNCPYQECDNLDQLSMHYLVRKNGAIVAYLRMLLPVNNIVKIGRVVVHKSERQNGFGIDIMQTAIADFNEQFDACTLKISAQQYLDKFYSDLGFYSTGKKYLEDDIPHQEMIFKKD
ncbi:MAG: GNAT family N-acetyltransferase [Crocinitomicaceae bacterium]|nr:GNAT family N-acetyltransferase [Crocinitomicaceae bacterium]|tara:strand:- start:87937 stop:88374 length:438 start_codon:yes stop_codon:yes gene_type:complete